MSEISTAEETLTGSSHESPHHRSRGLVIGLGAGVAGLAVAATATVGALWLDGHGAVRGEGLAIETISANTVGIHVVDSAASADEMTAQMRAQGLNVKIETMTASPQLVGTWLGYGVDSDVPKELEERISEQSQGYVATIELPTSFKGQVVLDVGVPPRSGEAPMVIGVRNALAPGGLLHCAHLSGAFPETALARATALGYSVQWSDTFTAPVGSRIASPLPQTRVTGAYIDDQTPKKVTFVLTSPKDVDRYEAQLRSGFAPGQDPSAEKNVRPTC